MTQDRIIMMSKFEYDACGSCYKTTFILANIVFILCSIAFFGVGLWLTLESSLLTSLYGSGSFYIFTAVSALVVGIFLLFLSVIGIAGALQEIGGLLAFYAAALILLFTITIIGSILGMVFRTQMVKHLKGDMIQSLENYDPSESADPITVAWDTIQVKFECCGLSLNSDSDPRAIWKRNKKLNSGPADYKLPLSCCPPLEKDILLARRSEERTSCGLSESWTKDCFRLAFLSTRRNYLILGIIALLVGTFMIIGITCSVVLARIALET